VSPTAGAEISATVCAELTAGSGAERAGGWRDGATLTWLPPSAVPGCHARWVDPVSRATITVEGAEQMDTTIHEHIEIVPGTGGPKAVIKGHRIRVQDVAIWCERLGMSVDEVVDQYPQLTMADVHAALAYYWDHRDEIESRIADDHAFADELRRQAPRLLEKRLGQLGAE
jgi:uncharacterized protein (DUF433 family)